MLVIHGSAAETDDYERAIILIGSAWGLDPQNAVSHLELITREKEAARGTAEPEETRHVLPESELPMNASGMETLDNVCGLFETAIQLESRDHREALFRLASKLMETQNLLDPPGRRLCCSLCPGRPLDWLSGGRYHQRQVMHMTIQQILREKGLSRYQLSKRSGIPWATLADICSGKTALTRCSAGTLGKLSAALDIPMEELLTMTVEQRLAPDGKPKDRSYLEKDLPASLQKALDEYIQGEKDHVSYMDCLWGELYGAINSNQWSNTITLEQADYLRAKYLY